MLLTDFTYGDGVGSDYVAATGRELIGVYNAVHTAMAYGEVKVYLQEAYRGCSRLMQVRSIAGVRTP